MSPAAPVLQIRNLDPALLRQLRIYEAEHGLSHAEVFTQAFQLLLAAEAVEISQHERPAAEQA